MVSLGDLPHCPFDFFSGVNFLLMEASWLFHNTWHGVLAAQGLVSIALLFFPHGFFPTITLLLKGGGLNQWCSLWIMNCFWVSSLPLDGISTHLSCNHTLSWVFANHWPSWWSFASTVYSTLVPPWTPRTSDLCVFYSGFCYISLRGVQP